MTIQSPEFIAEIGVNHGGDIKLAHEYLEALASAGGTIAKFQTYKAEKLVTPDAKAYWDTGSEATLNQIDLFRRFDSLDIDDYKNLASHCKDLGLEFMTTCFDLDSLSELHSSLDRIKIASADITNFQLLLEISKLGKPVLLSTGAATMSEVGQAVEILGSKSKDITLLHCVLNYPTKLENANIGRIRVLKESFPNFKIGYSDHTTPTKNHEVQIAAWLCGAQIIEKHFTLNKNLIGNDHYHSYDPTDLIEFISLTRKFSGIIHYNELNFLDLQMSARAQARRGIYFTKDIQSGTKIKSEDLISLRPVGKTPASEYLKYVGKELTADVRAGTQPIIQDFKDC
jgi:N-acetylneuraminate synthase